MNAYTHYTYTHTNSTDDSSALKLGYIKYKNKSRENQKAAKIMRSFPLESHYLKPHKTENFCILTKVLYFYIAELLGTDGTA